MWLLSEEAITFLGIPECGSKIYTSRQDAHLKAAEKVKLAQARHIYEEGENPCENKSHSAYWPYTGMGRVSQPNRFGCSKCRDEFRKEVGLV